MEIVGLLWNELVIRPMINSLLVLYVVLFNNFGLSILAFTGVIRLITLPLTLRQLRQTRAMSLLQPKMKEIQKKYGKDRQKASKETFRLYKEHGVSPLGCLGPLVIQMPILIGLFYALIQTLPMNPDSLADLSQKLYSWLGMVHQAVPVDGSFLGTDLGRIVGQEKSIWRFLMPILVGGSTWVQQKMSTNNRPAPAVYQHHDVVDVPHHACRDHVPIPQRACLVLVCLEYGWNRDSVFRKRLGESSPGA